MENLAALSDDTADREFVRALDLAVMGFGAFASVAGISPADKTLVDGAVAKTDAAIKTLIAAMPDNPDDLAGVAVVYNVKTADALVNRGFPKVAAASKAVIDASESARAVVLQVSAPERSKHNIKDVGLTIGMYQADHKEECPPDLKTLIAQGYLRKGATIESPISGRPYVYLRPAPNTPDPGKVVMAYDDAKLTSPSGDWYVALYYDLHVGGVSAQRLEEQLKNAPK